MEEKVTKRLPLGSVVILNSGIQKLMIISRGMVIPKDGKQYLFEYGGCIYPQGLVSDRLLYFNNEDIQEVSAFQIPHSLTSELRPYILGKHTDT